MARSDIFIVLENEKPVQWACFEFDETGQVNYLTSPYASQSRNFNWTPAVLSDSKPIFALNRNQNLTSYVKKDDKIYQIPLNESSAGRKVLLVLQLKEFEEEGIWIPVAQRANVFIAENTNDSVEQWIAQYPSDKPTISFPEEIREKSPFAADHLLERLQVKKCDFVNDPGTYQLADGHMEIWRDDHSKLNYRVSILGQEKTGKFNESLQKDIFKANKEGKIENDFASFRLKLSQCYLNLDLHEQNMILSSILNNWPLLDLKASQQVVIDEICRALIEDDDLNTAIVSSPEIQDTVRNFRSYLFISKIHEMYGVSKGSKIHVGDAQQFIRYLLATASSQPPVISPVDEANNVLCKRNKQTSYEDLLYLSLPQDNPLFSKLFLKYLTAGLEKFSLEEVIEFQDQMNDFIVLMNDNANISEDIIKHFYGCFTNEKSSQIFIYIQKIVQDLQNKCFGYQRKLLLDEFANLMQTVSLLDIEDKLSAIFRMPLDSNDQLNCFLQILNHFDEKQLSSSALVHKLFNEHFSNMSIFIKNIPYIHVSLYHLLFKYMQDGQFKLNTEQYMGIYKYIKKSDSKNFLNVFGEDLLNSITNENDLNIFMKSMEMPFLLEFIQQYPLKISELVSFYPLLWLHICEKDVTGDLFNQMIPFFKENQINFYKIFSLLNPDLRKILVKADFERLLLDTPLLKDKLMIFPYLNDEQVQKACGEFDMDDLNLIARSDIDDSMLFKILDQQFSRISADNKQDLFEFLNKLDKRILNYIIKHQSTWLTQNIQTPNQFVEMMNHLNSALFIKKQKQMIEKYFPTHQDFLILITKASNDKIRDSLIKHVKPSFNYQDYQNCILELQQYQKTLNERAFSFFTIQSSNKIKINHVSALLSLLKDEPFEFSSLKSDGMQTLKDIYKKYQDSVFGGQSFEELFNPQNKTTTSLSPRPLNK